MHSLKGVTIEHLRRQTCSWPIQLHSEFAAHVVPSEMEEHVRLHTPCVWSHMQLLPAPLHDAAFEYVTEHDGAHDVLTSMHMVLVEHSPVSPRRVHEAVQDDTTESHWHIASALQLPSLEPYFSAQFDMHVVPSSTQALSSLQRVAERPMQLRWQLFV